MNNRLLIITWFLLGYFASIVAQKIDLIVDEPIERYEVSVEEYGTLPSIITFGPLIKGHEYSIQSTSVNETFFLMSPTAYPTFDRAVNRFVAKSTTQTIHLWRPYGEVNEPIRISLADLTHLQTPTVDGLTKMMEGVRIQKDTNTSRLVNEVFSNQPCFETFNASFEGEYFTRTLSDGSLDTVSQLGTFSGGNTSVGFEEGIILTTGRVANAEGPNNTSFSTFDFDTVHMQADLEVLSGGTPIHDMAVLEFQFRPNTDTINFDYIFASEEYCEAVNNTNTDVFAFFISGPGINGPFSNNAENIAVLPDGVTTIETNTVSHLTNTQYYRNNVNPAFFEDCGLDNPVALDEIEYDGFTTVLTASAEVIPCEVYTLRMVVADVGDGFFDSAIMLVSGSFIAGLVSPEPLDFTGDTSQTTFLRAEGCNPFGLVLNRLDTSLIGDTVTVGYTIDNASTAILNSDYTVNQDSIVILPGQLTDTLFFDFINDGLAEGIEEVIINIQNTCNCGQNEFVIQVEDSEQLSLGLNAPTLTCADSVFTLSPEVSGGEPGYTYLWEDGNTDSLRTISSIIDTATYCVTITDACGAQDSLCVEVFRPAVLAQINSTSSVLNCQDESIELSALENIGLNVIYEWTNEDGTVIGDQQTQLVDQPGVYTLVVTDPDTDCSSTDQIAIAADGDLPQIFLVSNDTLSCANTAIEIEVGANTNDAINYAWSGPAGPMGTNSPTLAGITESGVYTVQATRISNQCSANFEVIVEQDTVPPSINLDVDGLINCRDSSTNIRATESENYSYFWRTINGTIFDGVVTPVLVAGVGNYELVVRDETNGCTSIVSTTVDSDFRELSALAGPDQILPCEDPIFTVAGSALPVLGGTAFSWLDAESNVVSTNAELLPPRSGIYTLEVIHPASFCPSTDQLEIISEGPESTTIDIIEPPCEEVGGQVEFTQVEGGTGPYIFELSGGTIDSMSANTFFDLQPGTYNYTITDQNGCELSEELEILPGSGFSGSAETLEISVGEDAQLGVDLNRTLAEIRNYSWMVGPQVELSCTDCPEPVATALESFIASVNITDIFGCILGLRQQVIVDETSLVFAPNAFSPGDQNGINDRFTLFGSETLIEEIESLVIYDRWGNQLWTSEGLEINNEAQGWDGNFNNQPVNSQVLIYAARVRLFDNSLRLVSGDFTLLR
ncbi:MAG: choice-of-anchor L domain-containing protein [Bacteroidota bacterium]